jgi:hypothetical protein
MTGQIQGEGLAFLGHTELDLQFVDGSVSGPTEHGPPHCVMEDTDGS